MEMIFNRLFDITIHPFRKIGMILLSSRRFDSKVYHITELPRYMSRHFMRLRSSKYILRYSSSSLLITRYSKYIYIPSSYTSTVGWNSVKMLSKILNGILPFADDSLMIYIKVSYISRGPVLDPLPYYAILCFTQLY